MSVLVSFHSTEPEQLVNLQKEHWEPLLAWARSTFGAEIQIALDSFLLPPHPEGTIDKFDAVLSKFDPWQMAGMFESSLIGFCPC